jgi:hypothetical protein
LTARDNFCNICGQENDNRNVSFWELITDFIEENLGVDSKLLRSLVPFLLRPGKLTQSFVSGQRKLYVPPLRLYLVCSLLCFVLFSFSTNQENSIIQSIDDERNTAGLSMPEVRRLDSIDFVSTRGQKLKLYDSLLVVAQRQKDTAKIRRYKAKYVAWDTSEFVYDAKINFIFGGSKPDFSFDKVRFQTDSVPDERYLDSTGWPRNWFTLRAIHQARRIGKSNQDVGNLAQFMVDNASTAAFVMVPLLALFLKALYFRRGIKYVAHLVHVLHLQGFLFLMISVYMVIFLASGKHVGVDILPYMWLGVALITLVYSAISIKVIHQQNWWITILKLIGLLVAFMISMVIVVIPLTAASFLFF